MRWFTKSKSREDRFAVLVHVRNVLLTDSAGIERLGGAYKWQYLAAPDRDRAALMAIESVTGSEAFLNEVRRNVVGQAVAEEIVPVRRGDTRRGTALIFYIDDDPAVQP